MPPAIRSFTDDDADAVVEVWLAATIPGQDFLPPEHWLAMESEVRDELLPAAQTWVVDEADEVVAFASLLGDLIGGLFTHPRHQGKGYGSALVRHCHQLVDPVFVEVFAANERAVALYRSLGFVDHEERVDPGSGLPLLILRLGEG